MTIHECDQDEALEPIQPIISNNKKPPVPKRIGQLSGERPSVPNKTMAATMAAVKQQQMQLIQQQSGHNNGKSNLPDFFINKNDMGKYLKGSSAEKLIFS